MKRILLNVLLVVISTTVMAGKGKIVVTSGNKKIFNESAEAVLSIDYSYALWEGEPYKGFCGNEYQERIERSYSTFLSSFNNNSIGLKLTTNNKARYKMTIQVHRFLRKIRSFYRGEVMIWCNIYLKDYETGEEKLVIRVEKSGGDSDYSTSDGIYKCFLALGKRITEIK